MPLMTMTKEMTFISFISPVSHMFPPWSRTSQVVQTFWNIESTGWHERSIESHGISVCLFWQHKSPLRILNFALLKKKKHSLSSLKSSNSPIRKYQQSYGKNFHHHCPLLPSSLRHITWLKHKLTAFFGWYVLLLVASYIPPSFRWIRFCSILMKRAKHHFPRTTTSNDQPSGQWPHHIHLHPFQRPTSNQFGIVRPVFLHSIKRLKYL